MTETTTNFRPNEEIQKLLNSLDKDETDINKITDVTHKCLLIMSVRDAAMIINGRKRGNENVDDEEEMKLFDNIVETSYLNKLASLEKKLLK